jgi:hypothetical protein
MDSVTQSNARIFMLFGVRWAQLKTEPIDRTNRNGRTFRNLVYIQELSSMEQVSIQWRFGSTYGYHFRLFFGIHVSVGLFLLSYVHLLYYVRIAFVTLDDGLLARSQYSEGPATGHLDTGYPWFPCVYKRMLRWFTRFQVATTCFSCRPPDLNVNLLVISFLYLYTC